MFTYLQRLLFQVYGNWLSNVSRKSRKLLPHYANYLKIHTCTMYNKIRAQLVHQATEMLNYVFISLWYSNLAKHTANRKIVQKPAIGLSPIVYHQKIDYYCACYYIHVHVFIKSLHVVGVHWKNNNGCHMSLHLFFYCEPWLGLPFSA